MKTAKLIMVTGDNNNKFYNMSEVNNELVVDWGRVGCKASQTIYPLSKWDSLLNSKIKKGYVDITNLKSDVTIANVKDISNVEIKNLINKLIEKAKDKVKANYLVSYKDVTEKQIEEAQKIIDSILEYRTRRVEVEELNRRFIELFKVIPRKMNNVKEHLLTSFDIDFLKKAIKEEQELLDNMKSQMVQTSTTDTNDKTILDIANIKMEVASDDEIKMIKEKLGSNSNQFVRAFRVTQEPNESDFNNTVNNAKNKKTELFWHGSRTENWWSILSNGLKIRPSNAVYTGSMFGDALYFADKAQKSIGYTSLSGSYWVKGDENSAYMCLYEVHVGKQKIVKEHTSSCKSFNKNNISADSVFAKAGKSLLNNEYMVYDSKQCTPRFLVEIKK